MRISIEYSVKLIREIIENNITTEEIKALTEKVALECDYDEYKRVIASSDTKVSVNLVKNQIIYVSIEIPAQTDFKLFTTATNNLIELKKIQLNICSKFKKISQAKK